MAESIFGRVAQLARANINALLDSAEDPEKMLDQMIRDYTDNIREAEDAVASTIGNLRMVEADHAEAEAAAVEWGRKAAAASAKADELRAGGGTAEADRFDGLAKVALTRQLSLEQQADGYEPAISQQNEVVEKLKTGLEQMKGKLEELRGKRDELVARAKMARAQNQVHDAVKQVSVLDPTSDLARFEQKVRREEARAIGNAELASSSLDSQFESLDDLADHAEVDARLRALKAGSAPAAIEAPPTP